MQLIILGSGSSIVKQSRRGPSFLLITNDNQKLLFDCGWGCLQSLLDLNLNPIELDQIFISHSHCDHLSNLIPILHSNLNLGSFFPEKARQKKLIIHGYPGFKNDYEQLRKIMFPERIEPYEIEIQEHAEDRAIVNNIEIITAPVNHVPQYFPSVAFRINHQGKSFTYSGDCGFDPSLIKLAQGSDLLLADASIPIQIFQKTGARPNHMSPFEVGQLADQANVKKLVLYHFYDKDAVEDVEKETKKNFKGEVFVPQDLQEIEF
jgi:ribonuclease BN (tRNA processing enzyme)